MTENDFINKLTSEHTEVKKAPSIAARFLKWMIICIFSLSVGVASLGLREDWQILFNSPVLLVQNLFILFSFIMTGFVAIKLSSPGALKHGSDKKLIYAVIAIWSLILITLGLLNGAEISNFKKIGLSCIRDIVVIGLIPGVALFFFILQGIVLKRSIAGFMAMLSAFALGTYGVQFTCHNDDAIHIFIWHFLPLISLSALGILIGRRFIKKI